jgi:ABC-type multidrug transport system ATPase subunit
MPVTARQLANFLELLNGKISILVVSQQMNHIKKLVDVQIIHEKREVSLDRPSASAANISGSM